MVKQGLPAGAMGCNVVSVEKSAPKQVIVGQPFNYSIKVCNLTKATLENVVVTETLPKNFSASETTPKAALGGGVATWAVGKLGPQQCKIMTVRGTALTTGSLVGCTDVAWKNPEVCLAINAVRPALSVIKTGPASVILCDPITYKITVKNVVTGDACNVKLSDALPKGMATLAGKTELLWNIGALKPGESRTVTFQAKAEKTGTYTNKAMAMADGGLTAASAPVMTKVTKPALSVEKTGPQMRFIGRPATYSIKVTNTGDAPAADTVLVDALPSNALFVSATADGKLSGRQVTWALGTLAPGASKTVSVTLNMVSMGTVRNAATANAYCATGAGEATTLVKGISAILLECVDVADPIEVGANETYVITVTNQGSAMGTGIVIECTLADEQEFVSATGAMGVKHTAKGKKVTFAALKSLDARGRAVYKVVVKGTKAGDVRFGVKLTSDQMDSPATETESTHIYADE